MDGALRNFQHFMDSGPGLLASVACWIIVVPVVAVVHELGHALAARRRVDGEVVVLVGAKPRGRGFRLRGIDFRISPLLRPWRFDARCVFSARGVTAADVVVIALAGPLATAISACCAYFALGLTSGFAHSLVWMTLLTEVGSTIVCLVPLTLTEGRRGRRMYTDGKLALEAFRRL